MPILSAAKNPYFTMCFQDPSRSLSLSVTKDSGLQMRLLEVPINSWARLRLKFLSRISLYFLFSL